MSGRSVSLGKIPDNYSNSDTYSTKLLEENQILVTPEQPLVKMAPGIFASALRDYRQYMKKVVLSEAGLESARSTVTRRF